MDTSRYQAFLSAAETGSIKNAAEELGYTPSGVSQLIKALEEELGFTLLYRSKKGVSLTLEGRRLRPTIREILESENRLFQHRKCGGCLSVRLTLPRISVWRRCGCHR